MQYELKEDAENWNMKVEKQRLTYPEAKLKILEYYVENTCSQSKK